MKFLKINQENILQKILFFISYLENFEAQNIK